MASMLDFLGNIRADDDEVPRLKAPAGAVDCHIHVFGPKKTFPHAKGAAYDPGEKPVEAYREVQERTRTSRVVLVQPSIYGFDNRCLLKALEALKTSPDGLHDDCARAICVVPPTVEEAELKELSEQGVVGMRFLMMKGKEPCGWDEIDRYLRRLHDLTGWDFELQMDGSDLHEVEKILRPWPCRLVIDHVGKFLFSKSLSQPGFKALRRLIDRGRTWVKLSSPYESSKRLDPFDEEVSAIARALVDWAPERMVWGSNWPHPDLLKNPPDDAVLLDRLLDWAPDATVRRRILVENAEELYGFQPWPVSGEG